MNESPLELVERALVEHGCTVRGHTSTCPNHSDSHPSLTFAAGTKGRDVVFHCHTGCHPDDIMRALGLAWSDFAKLNGDSPPDPVVAHYTYTDETGRWLFRVNRTAGKRFYQERYNGSTFVNGLGDTRRVLYRLPRVLEAVAKAVPVWLCEGEKDAERLEVEGLFATCNPMGAGKFTAQQADSLTGAALVVIVADNDKPGLEHAASAKALLEARGVPVITCRALEGKDVSDHLAAGHSLDALMQIDLAAELGASEPEAWEELLPLDAVEAVELPPFPLHVLPRWIRAHVEQQARALQVPADLLAVLALVGLAIACTGRVRVHVHSTWIEPANLYAVVVLPSGAGKSPAVRAMLRAVDRYEAQQALDGEARVAHLAQRRRVLERQMKKAEEKGLLEEARTLQDELLHEPPAVLPRLIADDATPEALADLLATHGERMALVSTEGGPFEIMAGRYGDKANLDVYLKAWSGDPLRVDRIGRGSTVAREPLLTVGLTVQPDVLRVLGERPELARRGLVQRFMYAMPKSMVGSRSYGVPTVAPAVGEHYDATLLALLHERAPITFELSPEALDAFVGWQRQLEAQRGEDGALAGVAEWTTKLESSVIRVAGLLAAADGHAAALDSGDMQRALEVGRYWLAHAQAVHGYWQHDPRLDDARAVAASLARRGVVEFSVRELYRALIRRFPTVEEIRPALELLTERNYVRPLFDGPLVLRRGVESPRFAVHPRLSDDMARMARGFEPGSENGAAGAHVAPTDASARQPAASWRAMSIDRQEPKNETYLLTQNGNGQAMPTTCAPSADDDSELL